MSSLESMICLDDFEELARQTCSKAVCDWIDGIADEGVTVRDNRDALRRIRLRPRCLRDVSTRDTSTTILGHRVPFPVAISPTAFHHWFHPEGELATAKAAAGTKTGMVLSLYSGVSLEDIAAGAPDSVRWINIAILKDRSAIKQAIERAENAGYKGIFVTCDRIIDAKRRSNWNGWPEEFKRNPIRFPNICSTDEIFIADTDHEPPIDPSVTWETISWLKSISKLPIVVKGILTAECAREAVKHGVTGILVSNHGGRQLDGVLATIDALPEVVDAVKGSGVEVYLDGGIRLGSDVFKALALGAKAVFIGRPVLWGLACYGEDGAKRVLEILQEEFDITMASAGCSSVAEITQSFVQKRNCNCANRV